MCQLLFLFRDAMIKKSVHWRNALASWTCPTLPSDSDGPCDPCSKDWSGNWKHMHCRGSSTGSGESSTGQYDGYVTNIHITDVKLDGAIPKELCYFDRLREFDLDGGRFTGPLPEWIQTCFPQLAELDLSFNRLSGTLPAFIANIPNLQEFEVGFNNFVGTIPNEYGQLPRLRSIELEANRLHGTIPATFSLRNATLTNFEVADNDLEGDLHMLAGAHLVTVNVHNNPKLCGMVPASVRYAKGYNPANTQLGKPCRTE